MIPQEVENHVALALKGLGEAFDHVQILVSWNQEGETRSFFSGSGNWFARQGMAHEFINKDFAQISAHQLAGKLQPPPDESEEWKE